MVQRRAKQRGLKQEALIPLADEELLKNFFDRGGFISEDGFKTPPPISPEASLSIFSLNLLLDRKSGLRLLIKTQADFCNGKIDKFGQPQKAMEVIRRKVKETSPPPSRKAGLRQARREKWKARTSKD